MDTIEAIKQRRAVKRYDVIHKRSVASTADVQKNSLLCEVDPYCTVKDFKSDLCGEVFCSKRLHLFQFFL